MSRRRRQRTQTVEATGKGWKFTQLLAFLALLAGVVCMYQGFVGSDDGESLGAIGVLLILAGLVLWIIGRLGAWWYHG